MSIPAVVIEFLAKGMPQVQQAFKSIQESAIRAERAQTLAAQRTEKALERTGRAAAAAARTSSSAANLEARARIAATRAAERELDQWQRKAQAAARQTAKVGIDAANAEAKARIQATREASREAERSQRRSSGQRNNYSLGRVVEGTVGSATRGVVSGLQRSGNIAMGLANTTAQLGGGFSLADTVMGEKNLRVQAARLSASTILTGKGGTRLSTDDVLNKAKAIGIEQATDPSKVLEGFEKIKEKTGDLPKAMALMQDVAKISTATGADLANTSELAGNILSINPNIENEELIKQLRVFTKQGVVGGVEIQDFARYGARITAGATMFGGNKEKNEATLGALTQMARQYGPASSAAEATMGAERFSTDIAKHSGSLKEMGINVSDGKGNLRDAQQIILEMLDKTKGDVIKLQDLGLGDRGVKPLMGAAAIYKNNGGGQAGLDAVRAEFQKYTDGVTEDEVDAANKRVLAEQGFEKSMIELKAAAGEKLLPLFKDMLPQIQNLIPQFVNLATVGIPAFTSLLQTVSGVVKSLEPQINWLAGHPIGSLIAFEITKSFASAGLPALLRGLITNAFGGGAGGAAGAAGGVTKLGAGLAGAAIGGAVGTYLVESTFGKEEDRAKLDSKDQLSAVNMISEIKSGKFDPNKAEQLKTALTQDVAAKTEEINNPGVVKDLITGMASFTQEGREARQKEFKNDTDSLNATKKALAELTDALNNAAKAANGNGQGGNSGSKGAGRDKPINER